MATYYNALVKDAYKVAHVLGDNIQTVKRHYMRAVPLKDCEEFWGLMPELVSKRDGGGSRRIDQHAERNPKKRIKRFPANAVDILTGAADKSATNENKYKKYWDLKEKRTNGTRRHQLPNCRVVCVFR